MNHRQFSLDEFEPKLTAVAPGATVTSYSPDVSGEIDLERRYPAIVIFPGGGYGFLSDREAEPVALFFLSMGFSAFVVRYAIAPERYPTQLLQAAAAVAFVRKKADEFHVNSSKVAVLGFSAGGHLAACMGTLFSEPVIAESLGISPAECRPDAMVLSYPVITSGKKAHRNSFLRLLGENADPLLLQKLSLENAVTPETPPAFLWHTFEDELVPVENALYFAGALRENGVPFELHIFQKGPHGLAMCDASTKKLEKPAYVNEQAASWKPLAAGWLKTVFGG